MEVKMEQNDKYQREQSEYIERLVESLKSPTITDQEKVAIGGVLSRYSDLSLDEIYEMTGGADTHYVVEEKWKSGMNSTLEAKAELAE